MDSVTASSAQSQPAEPELTPHEQWDQKVRGESPLQRLDRVFSELLQELRVAQVGVQILFAFLLTIAFQPRFAEISEGQRTLYAWTIFAAATAMALLVAPVPLHRLTYGKEMKPAVVAVAHVLTLLGLLMMMIAVVCAVGLVGSVTLSSSIAILLTCAVAAVMVGAWIVLPVVLMLIHHRLVSAGPNSG